MPKKPAKTKATNGAPEGARIISYSEMDTFRQCPLKHQLSYVERWKKPVTEGTPLARGSLWHLVMEEHYRTIKENSDHIGHRPFTIEEEQEVLGEAWVKVRRLLFDPISGIQTEDQELIQWMYEGYVEKYSTDNDWVILEIEYAFEVNLLDEEGQPSPYWMKGKIDIIAYNRENGGMWVWDHKSGKDLPNQMELQIDDQFGGYTGALQQLGYPVRGSMHNGARTTRNKGDLATEQELAANKSLKKQTPEQRMGRTYLNRTDAEVKEVMLDFWKAAVNAYSEDYGHRKLPIYSSPDPRQCGWKCDFKETHLIARATGRGYGGILTENGFVQDFTRH